MKFELTRQFEFDAAHSLPSYEGKCKKLHGHRYKLEVSLEIKKGKLNKGVGIDMEIIKNRVGEKVVDKLDHSLLNDTIKNPTMENICLWVFEQLKDEFSKFGGKICQIRLWETPNNSVTLYC